MNFELSYPIQSDRRSAGSDCGPVRRYKEWCAFPDLVGSDRVRKDFHYRQCDQGSAEADFDPES